MFARFELAARKLTNIVLKNGQLNTVHERSKKTYCGNISV